VPRCLWAAAASIALAMLAPSASATVTAINTFGSDGNERCLAGNAADRCTKGGKYLGAYSITAVFSAWSERSLARVDDADDKVWSAGSFGYIEIAGIAHYLSNHGTSFAGIWFDDGRLFPSEFQPFPAGTEVSPPDNRSVGVVLPGEKVTSDLLTGRVFDSSFIAMAVASTPFELVYRSRLSNGSVDYYSSDKTSRGFDNQVVSGKTLDHMVTWNAGQRIDSRGNVADVYLIAFERAHQDDDFQDAVYAISIPVRAVPEPPVWMILALGFGLTAWLRSRGAP
jgi:hypothetical protein